MSIFKCNVFTVSFMRLFYRGLVWVQSLLLLWNYWSSRIRPHASVLTGMGWGSRGPPTHSMLLFKVWLNKSFFFNYWCSAPAGRHALASTHRFGWIWHMLSLWHHWCHSFQLCWCDTLPSREITSVSLMDIRKTSLLSTFILRNPSTSNSTLYVSLFWHDTVIICVRRALTFPSTSLTTIVLCAVKDKVK